MNDLVDKVVRSDRRSLAIVVASDGQVTVRAPRQVTDKMIETFVRSKRDWILKTREKARKTYVPKPKTSAFEHGLPLFGERFAVHKTTTKTSSYDQKSKIFTIPIMDKKSGDQVLTSLYKKIARNYLGERLRHFADSRGYTVNTFRLSSAKTRWGSCSARGTISLNWKLVMAPPAVADYVILHELTHLDHMNHSKEFWDKLSKNFPDYERQRSWLKKFGKSLTLEGIQYI